MVLRSIDPRLISASRILIILDRVPRYRHLWSSVVDLPVWDFLKKSKVVTDHFVWSADHFRAAQKVRY